LARARRIVTQGETIRFRGLDDTARKSQLAMGKNERPQLSPPDVSRSEYQTKQQNTKTLAARLKPAYPCKAALKNALAKTAAYTPYDFSA
jgi:hypothetical protein